MAMKPLPPAQFDVIPYDGSYAVMRNDRHLMTPAGIAFVLPSKELALSIADEWRAQVDKIVPSTMPMTQLASTAFDVVSKNRAKIIEGLLAYIDSELLCHRTDRLGPLIDKQEQLWQPFLDWCSDYYGVCFVAGSGVMPKRQEPEVEQKLRKVIEALDSFMLAGLSCATDVSGSLVLGLSLMDGQREAQDILGASELDANHQALTWGKDMDMKVRQEGMLKELSSCQRWFAFLKTSSQDKA